MNKVDGPAAPLIVEFVMNDQYWSVKAKDVVSKYRTKIGVRLERALYRKVLVDVWKLERLVVLLIMLAICMFFGVLIVGKKIIEGAHTVVRENFSIPHRSHAMEPIYEGQKAGKFCSELTFKFKELRSLRERDITTPRAEVEWLKRVTAGRVKSSLL